MSEETHNAEITIWDDAEDHRYVIEVDGERAGLAVYHMRGGRHFFVHTEVSDAFSGQGLGNRLVRFALDDVRRQDGVVVPICPFFAAYIRRHPEYDDLVDQEIMARIEAAKDEEE